MMSSYLIWMLLSRLTGSFWAPYAILLGGAWLLQHFTLGVLPTPLRIWNRFLRSRRLERDIVVNPHNRAARFELADLLVGQRRYMRAVEVLKPNLVAGDDDAATLFLMGQACAGAGHADQAETFFKEALEREPEFRQGAIQLELGRLRLWLGDNKGAREALEKFCAKRHGTVEGRALLARAVAAEGDLPGAKNLLDAAWHDYATAPAFIQRQERLWAWRIKPWRPVVLALAAIAAVLVLGRMVQSYGASQAQARQDFDQIDQ